MVILFAVVIIVSIFHFVYESAWLPDFRLELRYKLFSLRDELRLYHIKNPDSKHHFGYADEYLNSIIKVMPFISFGYLIRIIQDLAHDPKLDKRIDKRIERFRDNAPDEIKRIYAKGTRIALISLAVNSGGWLPVLLPLAIVFFAVKFLFKISLGTTRKIQHIFSAPSTVLSRRIPVALELVATW